MILSPKPISNLSTSLTTQSPCPIQPILYTENRLILQSRLYHDLFNILQQILPHLESNINLLCPISCYSTYPRPQAHFIPLSLRLTTLTLSSHRAFAHAVPSSGKFFSFFSYASPFFSSLDLSLIIVHSEKPPQPSYPKSASLFLLFSS